jgi:hypothetical protein
MFAGPHRSGELHLAARAPYAVISLKNYTGYKHKSRKIVMTRIFLPYSQGKEKSEPELVVLKRGGGQTYNCSSN